MVYTCTLYLGILSYITHTFSFKSIRQYCFVQRDINISRENHLLSDNGSVCFFFKRKYIDFDIQMISMSCKKRDQY